MANGEVKAAPAIGAYATEYTALHDQRLAVIRSYNVWYAFGHGIAHAYFWLMLFLGLDTGRTPLLVAAAIAASLIIWFAYRVVLIIDRDVVRLYPRIVFIELVAGYDFYRDYLRNRPHGHTERSFIAKCDEIQVATPDKLWEQICSQFKQQDFPADRRVTGHFKLAAYLSIALFWAIVAIVLQPTYFPLGG
jgi:hypothetical protein